MEDRPSGGEGSQGVYPRTPPLSRRARGPDRRGDEDGVRRSDRHARTAPRTGGLVPADLEPPAGARGAFGPVSGAEPDDPHDDTVASKVWDSCLARRLLVFVRPHWGLFATSFVVLAVLFSLAVLGPWVWKQAIDGPVTAAMTARAARADAEVSGFMRAFWAWIGAYAG